MEKERIMKQTKFTARKRIMASASMLVVSAIMLSSATYAWFTMNKEVSVTNMQVKAVAEDGLLVNEVATADDTNWDNEATANQTAASAVLLHPSSTTDATTWYHGASKKSNSEAGATSNTVSPDLIGGAYTTLSGLTPITAMSVATATAGSQAVRSTMGTSATADAGYYVHYTYYLKSSGAEVDLTDNANSLSIESVTATLPDTQASGDLNPSIRVGIQLEDEFYIYAPVDGFTDTYYVAAGTTATTAVAGDTVTATDLSTLPAAGANGTPVEVYIWYEGEDEACKSDNAQAEELDNIKIDIVFSLTTADLP
jgi:hypothetical protein